MRRPGRFSYLLPSGTADPLLQEQAAGTTRINGMRPAMPSTLRSFEGLGKGFSGPQGAFSVDGDPPDPNGDIGPNHYLQLVNSSLAVFDRSGNALYGPVLINTLWRGFGGGCETSTDGDPTVKYDRRADRWIITQFSVTAPNYLECVAVSTTGDPTGSYYRYAYSFPYTNDYPKMAIWPDGYYFTFNMYDAKDNFVGGEICVMDRASMLAGRSASKQCFGPDLNWISMLAADLDGMTDPPSGSPAFIMSLGSATSLNLWKVHTDWTTPANSFLQGPASIAVARYTNLCANASDGSTCVHQLGTTTLLDSLGGYLMYRLTYRNMGSHESIVANHSVDQNGTGTGPGAIRWYEIRSPAGTPALYQQGSFAPDTKTRWLGSMAMDGGGNIAVGYSLSSSTMYPSIYFTGRLASDPLNTLPQGETALVNSTGYHFDSTGLARWGDYTSLSIDPLDDCTFWYTNEYFTGSVHSAYQWQTRVGSFKFPSCTTATVQSTSYTGLWWNASESGWGINFDQQGDHLFATLFTYDLAGKPLWLVMSDGVKQADGSTFVGDLYQTTGPAFNAQPFTPITAANLTKVGTMSVAFSGLTAATLNYSVNSVTVSKSIQPQIFGSRTAVCLNSQSSRTALTNYQDLWWNPAESGWGVNITQQDNTLFATLFTYDATGKALWLVMSSGPRQVDGSYLGDLYLTTGPAFNAQPFTPIGPANLTKVGTMQFRFSDGANGILSYTVNGISVSKVITRQVFSTPLPACAS